MKNFIRSSSKLFPWVLLLCFFISCSKEKTQKEKYDDMTSSFKYKTYKVASQSTMPPSVLLYNTNIQSGQVAANEIQLRLMLGYNWAVTGQSEFAFAESDIVEEKSTVAQEKFLAQILRSIVMYENGWDTLAKAESDLAIKNTGRPTSEVKTELIVFHLLVGTLFIKQKDFANAKIQFAGFGQQTGINWPYQLCDAADEFNKGNTQGGLKKIKIITEDPTVPLEIRTPLKEALTEIEKTTGDVNSSLFWPRAISTVLLKQLKGAADKQVKDMMEMVDNLSVKAQ